MKDATTPTTNAYGEGNFAEPSTNSKVRTRFAPSPTGMLHIGGLRSALFNYLWARKNDGEFILRLEDTDQARLVEGAREQIMASMKWLGLEWDYGPDKPHPEFGSCVQSERKDDYLQYIQPLIESGIAYKDWTTPEQLSQLREQAQAQKKPFVFRRHMATLEGPDDQAVIRIAIPDDIKIEWLDTIRGDQSWSGKDIGDFVAIKSDGYPTYQFANVVDDHLMGISHVIRADEWLSSTPKHLFLYDSLGWGRPEYVHIPPIMGPDGKKKLSKRDGAKSTDEYAKDGYLPETVMNFLSLLGWNPGSEQEIFTPNELAQAFSLDRVQKSGAGFDPVRLDWMSGMHMRVLGPEKLSLLADNDNWWPEAAKQATTEHKLAVMKLVFERLKKMSELPEYSHFFFSDPDRPDDIIIQKETGYTQDEQHTHIESAIELLKESDFSEHDLEERLYGYAKNNDLKVGKFFMLIRLIVTGGKVAPGLFETLNVIGKDITLKRLNN